jgi:hypothetical protein
MGCFSMFILVWTVTLFPMPGTTHTIGQVTIVWVVFNVWSRQGTIVWVVVWSRQGTKCRWVVKIQISRPGTKGQRLRNVGGT